MTHVPSPDGIPRIKFRIEALSDLVFGLALSLGAITLIQNIPQDPSHLINDVVLFGFSFLIIVGIWLGYTRIVSVLSVETSEAMLLNLALLFCVALEPFLYYVFQTQPAGSAFLDFSSAAFGLDIGSMMGLLGAMVYLVLHQEAHAEVHTLRAKSLRGFKVSMAAHAICAAIFLVSISDVFWVQVPNFGYLRFLLWYIALGIFFISRPAARMTSGKETGVVSRETPPQ